MLKPSPVWKEIIITRDLKLWHVHVRARKLDLWNGDVVVPCILIFSWQPGF